MPHLDPTAAVDKECVRKDGGLGRLGCAVWLRVGEWANKNFVEFSGHTAGDGSHKSLHCEDFSVVVLSMLCPVYVHNLFNIAVLKSGSTVDHQRLDTGPSSVKCKKGTHTLNRAIASHESGSSCS